MTINSDDILNSILESLEKIDYIKPEEIPNIDLYMDQVTTFMEANLKSSKRYDEDKILTKTMINNYAKNNLLPPPVKKKYSREHLLVLIFIYYFKNILSIKDIETLLKPITDKYFQSDSDFNLTSVYEEVFSLEKNQIKALQEEIKKSYATSQQTFQEFDEKDRDFLQTFSFICILSFDIYVKKQMIEQLIDTLPEPDKHKKK